MLSGTSVFVRIGSSQLCQRRLRNAFLILKLWLFSDWHKNSVPLFFFEALGLQSFVQDNVAVPIALSQKQMVMCEFLWTAANVWCNLALTGITDGMSTDGISVDTCKGFV